MADEGKGGQSLFRQQALEYISTPQALDDLIQVISPWSWIIVVGLLLILGMIIAWLGFGSVATYVDGKGVALTDHEAVVTISALSPQPLRVGMRVQSGRAIGQVTAVESSPATPENMLAELKNPSLVNYFLQAGPVIVLHTQFTGYIGKPDSFIPGSLIDARIIIRRQSPLSLMLSRQ